MFYKIIYELPEHMPRFFDFLKNHGNTIYTGGSLYFNTDKKKQNIITLLQSNIPNLQFLVIEINDKNIAQQPEMIRDKFHKERKKKEEQRFEDENQIPLRNYNYFLDMVESNLEQQLEAQKKGGKNSAELQK